MRHTNRTRTHAHTKQVQSLVRELIKAGCPVYRQEVALSAAKQVKTLRAVFGEVSSALPSPLLSPPSLRSPSLPLGGLFRAPSLLSPTHIHTQSVG